MKRCIVVLFAIAAFAAIAPASATEQVPTDIGTPIRIEATDDYDFLNDEVEMPPQPRAAVAPWCLQQIHDGTYGKRYFAIRAMLDNLYVDHESTYRLILRGKQDVNTAPVTLMKFDELLMPGDFVEDVELLALEQPYVVSSAYKVYESVRAVVKLVQPGRNPVLSYMTWNKVSTMFKTPTCTIQVLQD